MSENKQHKLKWPWNRNQSIFPFAKYIIKSNRCFGFIGIFTIHFGHLLHIWTSSFGDLGHLVLKFPCFDFYSKSKDDSMEHSHALGRFRSRKLCHWICDLVFESTNYSYTNVKTISDLNLITESATPYLTISSIYDITCMCGTFSVYLCICK